MGNRRLQMSLLVVHFHKIINYKLFNLTICICFFFTTKVYILDDQKIITLALGKQPSVVEKNTDVITNSMTNITGCMVKIWRKDSNTNNM